MSDIQERPNTLPWPPLIYVAAVARELRRAGVRTCWNIRAELR